MVAGWSGKEAVYTAELYLKPNYSCVPAKPMAPWFLQLLGGPSARFNTLAEAAYELNIWEPHAKIMRYRACKEEHQIMEAEISELTGRSASLQEHIDNCRSQLNARGVPFMLQNLEGCTELLWSS